MKQITRRIELDLSRKTNTRVVFASEADFGSREFIITLLDDGVPYPLSNNLTATVNIRRPDGTGAAYIGEITKDGCIRYVAGLWALGIPGETCFSVSVYDGQEKKVTSSSFIVNVEEGLYLGDEIAVGDQTYTAFNEMMNRLAYFQNAEEARKKAEGSADSSSAYYGGRAVQEMLRQDREIARQSAETLRQNSEAKRENAEEARKRAEGSADSSSAYYGGRAVQEMLRQDKEIARQANEEQRVKNEKERIAITSTLNEALANLIVLQEEYIAKGAAV